MTLSRFGRAAFGALIAVAIGWVAMPSRGIAQAVQGIQGGRAVAGDAPVAVGGTAQTMFGGAVPVHGWSVANPNATDDLWCSDSTTAAANGLGSNRIPANGGLYGTPDLYYPAGPVSCVGPVTGDKITARRW